MRPLRLGRLALLAPHAVVIVLALSAHSMTSSVLGRYSKALFAFNALSLTALAVAIVACARGALRAALPALGVLFALSFIGATNNDLGHARLGIPMMIASRFGDTLLLLVLAFDASRDPRSRARSKRLLAAGSALLMFNTIDVAGAALFGTRVVSRLDDFPFRAHVDLARIEHDAVVVVGDSAVWGQGVKEDQAVAEVMARRLAPVGTPVYNLGLVGAGLPEYLAALQRVPERDTAIVCYSMNDMGEHETLLLSMRQALVAMGRTSFAARLLGDLAGARAHPNVGEYEQSIVTDYDKRDPTYALRWHQVTDLLAQVAVEAKRGARRQPILVILPLMYEFSQYPLREAHQDLAALGRADGFEVVDMLPVFSEAFPHGGAYTVAPNDAHFNAEVHAKLADVLLSALARQHP
jgi:lysophospholipase L1-like esterase